MHRYSKLFLLHHTPLLGLAQEKQQMVAAELQAEKFARKIKKGVAEMEEEQKKQKKTAAVADKHKKARPRVTAAVHDG